METLYQYLTNNYEVNEPIFLSELQIDGMSDNNIRQQLKKMTQAIEKDYYVTMLLHLLSKKMPYIVFKGGTSLSKCHKVIKRFSEDIDITIDTPISQGQKKKVKLAIVDSVDELGMTIENLDDTRSCRDYNRYVINYEFVLHYLRSVPFFQIKITKINRENTLKILSIYQIYFIIFNFLDDIILTENHPSHTVNRHQLV